MNTLIFSKVHYCYFNHCRLVGDNIDHEIFVRVQTKENHNCSIHWTYQYAVLDRVQCPSLDDTKSQKLVKDLQFRELLPNISVQNNMLNRWAVLVSRIVYLQHFTPLKKRVVWHIHHGHIEEMAQQSHVVSE